MEKVRSRLNSIKVFTDEVIGEMRKSTWPNRQELVESTIVVIVSVLMLSVYVGIGDKLLVTILKKLIPSG